MVAGDRDVAASSEGGLDSGGSAPRESGELKRATYEDVLNAPDNLRHRRSVVPGAPSRVPPRPLHAPRTQAMRQSPALRGEAGQPRW